MAQSLHQIVRLCEDTLAGAGIEDPRTEAEWLVAATLHLPRTTLHLRRDTTPPPAETRLILDRLQRRALREPLQYILRSAVFCGLELEVEPGVLIPRPETEELADLAAGLLPNHDGHPEPTRAVDVGTGSGCLAITLARRRPGLRMTAIDRSAAALRVAARNIRRHPATPPVQLVQGSLLDAVRPAPLLDLIISNPPYIPSGDINALQPEVRDHEPRGALDGGSDGLDFYRALARDAPARLRSGGQIAVEHGDGQGPGLAEIFASRGWSDIRCHEDLSGRGRILVARPGSP